MRLSIFVLILVLVGCGFHPSGNVPGVDDGVDAVPNDSVGTGDDSNQTDASADASVDAPPLLANVQEFTMQPDTVRFAAGHPVQLGYIATARRCVASATSAAGDWSGELLPDASGNVVGSRTVVPQSGQNTYNLQCFGDEGSQDTASVAMHTLVMNIDDPDYSITLGASVPLHWQSPGTENCSGSSQDLSGGPMNGAMPQGGGSYSPSGTLSNFAPNESGTHRFICPVNGVPHEAYIRITVTPP